MLTSLSKRLSSTATTDTASCLTAVTEKIVQGVTGAFQQAKVCLTSVSTQTTETGHEKSKAADQAVPIDVTIIGESNSRDLYGGANEHAVEASGCSNNKHLSETLPDVANNQLDQKGCLESSICPKSQELVDAKPLWTTSELKNEGTKTADSFVKGTMLGMLCVYYYNVIIRIHAHMILSRCVIGLCSKYNMDTIDYVHRIGMWLCF